MAQPMKELTRLLMSIVVTAVALYLSDRLGPGRDSWLRSWPWPNSRLGYVIGTVSKFAFLFLAAAALSRAGLALKKLKNH